MVQQWCCEELDTADFGDQRLNARVVQVLESLADRPTASIPTALGGCTELEASYRFFGNDKVAPEKILKRKKTTCYSHRRERKHSMA